MTVESDKERGIRNKNPLNIEYSKNNDWHGQVGHDGRFAIFSSPVYGFRAAARIIANYREKHGIDTLAGVIGRWAPKSENSTDAYINYVAEQAGLAPNSVIDASNIVSVLAAMVAFENGAEYASYYDTDTIAKGVQLA
ncbi:hypothetical protein [Salinivibrio sp. PR919]|uniref:hypothetical protein n=1 Tax=Salinivibrio sp. PR919 TaxID=1909491 RepID=UPI001055C36D|nr:hypothetical protein [Salinivibrio sp. PR919]